MILNCRLESDILATLSAQREYVTLPKNDFMDWAMGIVNHQVHARFRHRFPWAVGYLCAHKNRELYFSLTAGKATIYNVSSRMAKKRKPAAKSVPEELWVAPRYSLKGPAGERGWDNHIAGVPSNSRYLELADIAMGVKEPAPFNKRKGTAHQTEKAEPYSKVEK